MHSSSPPAPAAARRIAGRYRVERELGAGGMGTVYRVHDDVTGRSVALKQLKVTDDANRSVLEAMFGREYHMLARLKHPRVIEVYDYGRSELGPYYTMELLDAADLRSRAPLPAGEVCRHLRDIASSLALLHAQRFVHRDVSPRNVCFSADGKAKLIDFGALHAFGVANDIVGTPQCVAPEALRRMPLDLRCDLFGLGAVAYFALTGRHAFPARSLAELPAYWSRPPQRPAELVPAIPPALDQLVMALLSVEPDARPSSDAELIDQLGTIGQLPPEELPVITSYLHSSRIVGRDDELTWVEQRVMRCLAGRGTSVLLEGPAGIGRTRLLHELGLRAQLLGAIVLKADASAHGAPFEVAARLAVQALAVTPDSARLAASGKERVLALLSPELAAAFGVDPASDVPSDPAQRRARLQSALVAWFTELARNQSVVLAVDNLHSCDEPSCAWLAILSAEATKLRLLVLGTRNAQDGGPPSAALQALRKRAAYLKLGRLTLESCKQLVISLFGDVPNASRTARLLHHRSGGNPQLCVELAQLLVRHEIARYVSGSWVLPAEVDDRLLPKRDAVLIAARLAELRPAALGLAEVLSLHARGLSLPRCLTWSEAESESETHAALDALLSAKVLIEERGEYRFEQASLREALYAQMDDGVRRARHRRVAEDLAASESLEHKLRSAWHWMEAGEESRGADVAARLGYTCFASAASIEDVESLLGTFARAAQVYEREHRTAGERCALLFPLICFAWDKLEFSLVVTHGEPTLQLGLEFTGLRHAQERSRYLGGRLALFSSLLPAALAVRFKKSSLGFDFRQAMAMFSRTVFVVIADRMTRYDVEAVRRIRDMLAPLALFGEQLPAMVYHFATAQLSKLEGRLGAALEHAERDKAWLDRPEVARVLDGHQRNQLRFAILYTEAQLATYDIEPRIEPLLQQLQVLGVSVSRAIAAVRTGFHARRGEADQARVLGRNAEVLQLEAGGERLEVMWLVSDLEVGVPCRNAIELRRVSEQLARHAAASPSLVPYARAAQAAYLMLRGQARQALALFEALAVDFEPRKRDGWATVQAAHAETLNQLGEHDRARQLMLAALSNWSELDQRFAFYRIPLERQLALSEVGLADCAQAAARIDALLASFADNDHPLLVGLLHKTRAEIALSMRDTSSFEREFSSMAGKFHATKNSALVAQCAELARRALEVGIRAPVSLIPGAGHDLELLTISRTLDEISIASDRYEYALRLMLQRAKAQAGWLYRFEQQALHLVTSTRTEPPAAEIEAELHTRLERLVLETLEPAEPSPRTDPATSSSPLADSDRDADRTMIVEPESPQSADEPPVSPYRTLVLSSHNGGQERVVGGVILYASPEPPAPLASGFVDAIADALHARRVLTIYPAMSE